MRKFLIFISMERRSKLLFIEAFFLLGLGRVLKHIPFSKISPRLGVKMGETPFNCNKEDRKVLSQISQSIYLASKYTFWESECLVKAFAARYMLNRRGIDSTLYLGTAIDEKGKLFAHAWLRSGQYYITGKEGMEKFTVVMSYAKNVGPVRRKLNEIL